VIPRLIAVALLPALAPVAGAAATEPVPAGPGGGGARASSPPPDLPKPPAGELPAGGPDLAVTLRDGRRRVRRGRHVRYRVRVRNHGTASARDVSVRVQLPRALKHLRGGTLQAKRRVRWRIGLLPAGTTRTLNLHVRVRPRARARAITLTARAAVKDEELRGDNRARDTNRVRF
jgi:hypothetical protein